MTPRDARMFIQPHRPRDIQRPTEPRIRVRDDRHVRMHRDHLADRGELGLRHDGQVRLAAVGARGAAASEVEKVEADRGRDAGGDAVEDAGADEAFVCRFIYECF